MRTAENSPSSNPLSRRSRTVGSHAVDLTCITRLVAVADGIMTDPLQPSRRRAVRPSCCALRYPLRRAALDRRSIARPRVPLRRLPHRRPRACSPLMRPGRHPTATATTTPSPASGNHAGFLVIAKAIIARRSPTHAPSATRIRSLRVDESSFAMFPLPAQSHLNHRSCRDQSLDRSALSSLDTTS